MKALASYVLAMIMAGPVAAEDRADLIAQIESAGQNEYKDERHAVKINDCQLTTYRWKQVEGEGWVLWTSFEFPMLLVDLAELRNEGEVRHYMYITQGEGEEQFGDSFILFQGKDGFEFTHEKPFHRTPKGEYEPSSRGDGTTHYIEKKSSGYISHTGADVEEKAHLFTTGYLRYVQQYCAFIG